MTDDDRAALWRLIDQFDETWGADHVAAAVQAALAAWPRTCDGKLRITHPDDPDLWRALNRCASGVVHPNPEPDEQAETAEDDSKPLVDDDLPF